MLANAVYFDFTRRKKNFIKFKFYMNAKALLSSALMNAQNTIVYASSVPTWMSKSIKYP